MFISFLLSSSKTKLVKFILIFWPSSSLTFAYGLLAILSIAQFKYRMASNNEMDITLWRKRENAVVSQFEVFLLTLAWRTWGRRKNSQPDDPVSSSGTEPETLFMKTTTSSLQLWQSQNAFVQAIHWLPGRDSRTHCLDCGSNISGCSLENYFNLRKIAANVWGNLLQKNVTALEPQQNVGMSHEGTQAR